MYPTDVYDWDEYFADIEEREEMREKRKRRRRAQEAREDLQLQEWKDERGGRGHD